MAEVEWVLTNTQYSTSRSCWWVYEGMGLTNTQYARLVEVVGEPETLE